MFGLDTEDLTGTPDCWLLGNCSVAAFLISPIQVFSEYMGGACSYPTCASVCMNSSTHNPILWREHWIHCPRAYMDVSVCVCVCEFRVGWTLEYVGTGVRTSS